MVYNEQALNGITEILELELETVQAELAEVNVRVSDLKKVIADLDKTSSSEAEIAGLGFSATGADMAWRTWVERRRRTVLNALAQIMAQRENIREKLRKAHGKEQSFKTVIHQMHQEQKRVESRKLQKQSDLDLIVKGFST